MKEKEIIDRVVNSLKGSGSKNKMPECEYFRGDTCTMTTHETCKGCRFYSPNTQEKSLLLALHIKAIESENKTLEAENKHLTELIENANKAIAEYKTFAELVKVEVVENVENVENVDTDKMEETEE